MYLKRGLCRSLSYKHIYLLDMAKRHSVNDKRHGRIKSSPQKQWILLEILRSQTEINRHTRTQHNQPNVNERSPNKCFVVCRIWTVMMMTFFSFSTEHIRHWQWQQYHIFEFLKDCALKIERRCFLKILKFLKAKYMSSFGTV